MIAVELVKQLRRLRTWIAFGFLVGVPVVAGVANKLNPGESGDGEGPPFAVATTASGLNHALASLGFQSVFFLVIVVALFGGETIAGEANWGTLRYLLVRPVARRRLLLAKLLVAFVFATAATFAVTLSGLASGVALFGWKPLQGPLIFTTSQGEALYGLTLSTVYVVGAMLPILTFGLMLSTMTDIPAGAIGGAFGLSIVSQILDAITGLGPIRYALPTHYTTAWVNLFFPIDDPFEMVRGTKLHLVYALVFLGVALWWFQRKDVLS
ncbi:MAG: ABC transporter permease [Actinomycetota bacterium]|nr:ABC transporter permease [Actinomycetota bacterium]